MRLAIDFNGQFVEVHNPDFRNACVSVGWKLVFLIRFQRRIGNFHQQKNILGLRMTTPIKISDRPEQCHIRFRLRMIIQMDRAMAAFLASNLTSNSRNSTSCVPSAS